MDWAITNVSVKLMEINKIIQKCVKSIITTTPQQPS